MIFFSPCAVRLWVLAVIISVCCASADIEEISRYAPIVNNDALRGMSTVTSAQSTGYGRMAISASAQWYMQQKAYVNTPNKNAGIYTGVAALAYGLTPCLTLFASQAAFLSNDYNAVDTKGFGSFKAGLQAAIPLPDNSIIHLAGQAAVYGGTSKNQINTNYSDGYNYFETRTAYDIEGKLLQTVCLGNADIGLKVHLNESGVWQLKSSVVDPLLLMSAGVQGNIKQFALGMELNSRTYMRDINLTSDPLWVTPTVYFRMPCKINISAGADISLSANRPTISQPGRIYDDLAFQSSYYSPRALEPYRLFVSMSFLIDFKKNRPNARLTHTQQQVLDQAELSHKAALADTLQVKAVSDSLMLIETKQKLAAEQAKLIAEQAKLVEIQENHASDQSKLTEAEDQLRSTGMLLLSSVYFPPGRTEITINSKSYLNIIAKLLLKFPQMKIQIEGHTDNIGNPKLNLKLSKGRAESVLRYLLKIEPGLQGRISAVGYGQSKPKADNHTAEGREINRRVQLRIIN
jgi:outer membrane protein OmpA-like peptidoglycan-associated protein